VIPSSGQNSITPLFAGDSTPVILPSMLLCDFANLQREAEALEAAGFRGLHLDIMDGVFVPNISYGLSVVKSLRRVTRLPLDVHLMIANPAQYVEAFREAGADIITFHAEATTEHAAVLEQIRRVGAAPGIVVNPQTPVAEIDAVLSLCDIVLVMSVQAGFGGQAFKPEVLPKFEELRNAAASKSDLVLEIDGGINRATIGQAASAGAQWFVVGSGIFAESDYAQAHQQLLAAIDSPGLGGSGE
jgi:ribulose-phosphate 3-epimerase